MKNIKLLIITCIVLLFNSIAFGQRSKELKCFDNFEFENSGNSRVNAYLLAMVNYNMYPHNLLGVENGASAANDLSQNNDVFLDEFIAKMTPWFQSNKLNKQIIGSTVGIRGAGQNVLKKTQQPIISLNKASEPIIEFISESNNGGYDPEVMIISTDEYILLAWRGTDRVSSNTPLIGSAIFGIGEWLQTNLDFPLVSPPGNIPGRVHRGFNTSINYNGLIATLADRLTELDVSNKKLWITGHSLGGAHAQISALYLKEQHDIQAFSVYAYAAPGVGDERFCNAIEGVVPGSKLQRFTYLYDPVPRIPSVRVPGMGDYTRAGQLNFYNSEQGDGNYFNNKRSKPEFPAPFLCHHNPHWYARAAFFELLDKTPTLESKVPDAPSLPTEGCTALDYQMANGNDAGLFQSLLGIDQDISPGTYYIINAKSGHYLNLNPSDFEGNGKPIRIAALRKDKRFKWKVRAVGEGMLGGYRIYNRKNNKLIEADKDGVGEQNSMVRTWDKSINVFSRMHQEWEIERLDNGRFQIKNIKNRGFKLRATNTGRIVLDDNNAASSQWYFVKI